MHLEQEPRGDLTNCKSSQLGTTKGRGIQEPHKYKPCHKYEGGTCVLIGHKQGRCQESSPRRVHSAGV